MRQVRRAGEWLFGALPTKEWRRLIVIDRKPPSVFTPFRCASAIQNVFLAGCSPVFEGTHGSPMG